MVRYQPLRPCPTVLDNQNIEHELLERVARSSASLPRMVFNNIEWRKVRRLEHEAWRSVTVNLATSALDAERIRAAVDVPVEIVPNGVAVDAYDDARNHPRTAGRVVFVGAMRHQPNADGARWYVQHVHPLVLDAVPEATFEIVGADPPENLVQMASTTVRVTGRVESVVPNLAAASVVVVPLHAGGGTRLKILEAFAAGVPVVSTTIGAEGLDVVPNQHLLIADTAHDFADAVVRVLRGVNLPDTFRIKDARQLVEDRYDWKTGVVPALTSAYDRAIEVFDRVEKEQGSGT
jgi:glycosyltransferase involved in cell wall biosynthesis